jgi:hypothetical protein
MWFTSLFATGKPRSRRTRPTRRRNACRPSLETLEDRTVPAFLSPLDLPPAALGDVTAGDFNGDAVADLVGVASANDAVEVLLGNGDGAFQPARTSPAGTEPRALEAGDFNGDGRLDVVTFNAGSPTINVLLGDGEGRFQSPKTILLPRSPASSSRLLPDDLRVADMNADGNLDLAILGDDPDSRGGQYYTDDTYVVVYLGAGDGKFAQRSLLKLDTTGGGDRLALGDFNQDGYPDVLAAVSGSYLFTSVHLHLGRGDGSLLPGVTHGTGSNVAVADFNADGRLDFVTTSAVGNALLRLGNGDGSFRLPISIVTGLAFAGTPAGADLTGDGVLDLVSRGSIFLSGIGYRQALAVAPGNGDGSFQPAQTFLLPGGEGAFATADFNADDLVDVALSTTGVNGLLLLNDGDWGTPPPPPPPPPPALRIDDVSVTEGDAGTTEAVFNVTLSAPATGTVTVDYSTGSSLGGDFLPSSGRLTFAPGETSKTVTVLVIGDTVGEPNEPFSIELSNASAATIEDRFGVGTIVNDDPLPEIRVSDTTVVEGNSAITRAVFTVTLSAPSIEYPLEVNYATTSGGTATVSSDYYSTIGTLFIEPGVTTATFEILIIPDTQLEPDETFFVAIDTYGPAVVVDGQAVGTILNDDAASPTPTLSISDVSKKEGRKGTTYFTFTVTLSAAATEPVTVRFATANGTAKTGNNDYVAKSGTLTFNPGETVKTITIAVKGDRKREAHEQFFVDLSSAVGALIDDGRGIGTILNDD